MMIICYLEMFPTFIIYIHVVGKGINFHLRRFYISKRPICLVVLKVFGVRDQLKMTINGNNKAEKLVNKMYESGFTAKAVVQYTGSLR